MTFPSTPSFLRRLLTGVLLLCCLVLPVQAESAKVSFDIAAAPAERSLKQLAQQSGVEVLYPTAAVKGVTTQAVKGEMTPREALDTMLAGTPLVTVQDPKTGSLTVRRETTVEPKNAPSRPSNERAASDEPKVVELPTFEVMGSKLLNMDIRRTRDDAQPYVVFGREQVANSGATDLNEFLKQRLTMNTTARSNEQQLSLNGATSSINLRGLGPGQTLILIDGHRVAGFQNAGLSQQADLNSIPLSAVERIEVLPATASGIYGGSATGGVINVILRRDYAGAEVTVTYENSFETDAANRRVDLAAGFNLEGGRTNVLIAGSFTSANQLLARDTDLGRIGRARILANNPGFYLNSTTPPAGATPNIRSSNGSNLVLKTGVALNSPRTFIPAEYAGPATDGGAALVANAGQYNFALAPSAESAGGGGAGLISVPTRKSLSTTIRRQFSASMQAFLDVAVSDNESIMPTNSGSGSFALPATAPNNPFTTAITVQTGSPATDGAFISRQQDYRAIGGVIVQLPWRWKAETDLTWNHNRFSRQNQPQLAAAAGTAIATGSPDIMRDLGRYPIDLSAFLGPIATPPVETKFHGATLRLAGPAGTLPAGEVSLSSLLEYRREQLSEQTTFFTQQGASSYVPPRSQSIRSAYVEARLPILSDAQKLKWARTLDLQLAMRYDEYTLTGSPSTSTLGAPFETVTTKRDSVDSTIGLRFVPVPSIAVRGSYGTGFVPPNTRQLTQSPFTLSVSGLTDPKRGGTQVAATGTSASGNPIIQTTSGGNAALKPELSESWSAGIVLTPEWLPRLRLSVDYTSIHKRDNITTLVPQAVITNEDFLPGRIQRGPVPAGDPFGVGPITFIDFTAMNLAQAQIEAYDLQLDYATQTHAWGKLELFASATLQEEFKSQLTPAQPVVDSVGVGNPNGAAGSPPLRFKANGGLTWTRGRWSLAWVSRYFDGYQVSADAVQILNQGNGGRVSSQVYHDFSMRYRFGSGQGAAWAKTLFSRLEVQVGVKNVFNRLPPFDAANTSFLYSYFGDPRLSGYHLTLKKAF